MGGGGGGGEGGGEGGAHSLSVSNRSVKCNRTTLIFTEVQQDECGRNCVKRATAMISAGSFVCLHSTRSLHGLYLCFFAVIVLGSTVTELLPVSRGLMLLKNDAARVACSISPPENGPFLTVTASWCDRVTLVLKERASQGRQCSRCAEELYLFFQ